MLALLLLLVSPLLAREPSKAERISVLEAEVKLLKAEQEGDDLALALELTALREELRLLRDSNASCQADLDEAGLRIGALEEQVDALVAALAEPPKKGADRRVAALLTEQAGMKAEIDKLKADLAALEASKLPARPNQEQEEAASLLYTQMQEAYMAGDLDRVKALGQELAKRYPGTRAARTSERTLQEVAVVGTRPGEPEVLQWFTRPAKVADKPVTLVVFWEVWCPHCKREVPRLPAWIERYGDRGLQVIALTRITKSATAEKVAEFIKENGLSFPIGQEDGAYAQTFGVSGIPAAAIVVDGAVVWRGHPAKIDDALLERWLAAR